MMHIKLTNTFLFLSLITLFVLVSVPAQAKNHSKPAEANQDEVVEALSQVSSKFNNHKNKIGRVNITQVAPLSFTTQDAKTNSAYFLGVSILTQEDVVMSPGFSAGFQF